MNRFLHFALFIVLISIVSACDKNDINPNPTIDWNGLRVAVIGKDNDKAGLEISKLLIATEADPIDADEIGQQSNITKLISAINSSGVISAELICYACIETLPPQTEIRLTTMSTGGIVTRVIDISTPDDGVLKYLNIHD